MGNEDPGTREPITFGTDGWRAPLSTFTSERVRMVGQAVATYLEDRQPGAVAIGYDAREHSRGFAEDLASVLTANGRDVVLSDRDCPTPALAWTVASGDFAGGLVVTASHNPPSYNGVKFVPADGAPAVATVTDELERQLEPPRETGDAPGSHRERDLRGPYIDHVADFLGEEFGIDVALDGLTVAYDAMYGSGRGVTDEVLARAGATVSRRRCERVPDFGGTAPEPTPENASGLVDEVTAGGADIGFVNDGDSDRVGIVTTERGFLDPNVVLALVYDFLLEYGDGDVVRTVPTSSLVDRIAAANGRSVHETAVGFKWVAEAMGDHDVLAGGEESGGYGVTAHLRNKDGVLVALIAAAAHVEQPLDERIDELFDTYGEIRQGRRSVDCPDEEKTAVLDALEGDRPDRLAGTAVERASGVDGVKLVLEDGTWVLVRPSGTEPKLRIYAEATADARVTELLDAGKAIVDPLVDTQ
jgi:phosphomannomutase